MALAYSYIRSVYAGNSRMVFCSGFSFYDYTCWNDLRNNNDKTKSIWPAIFLHAAHNTFDQLIFGTVTVANNKMFFVSETGIFTIIFA